MLVVGARGVGALGLVCQSGLMGVKASARCFFSLLFCGMHSKEEKERFAIIIIIIIEKDLQRTD